jgi:hypothetical protein
VGVGIGDGGWWGVGGGLGLGLLLAASASRSASDVHMHQAPGPRRCVWTSSCRLPAPPIDIRHSALREGGGGEGGLAAYGLGPKSVAWA